MTSMHLEVYYKGDIQNIRWKYSACLLFVVIIYATLFVWIKYNMK